MRTMNRVLAATMLLLTACTALSLAGTQSAMAFPPNPCDWADGFDGF